MSRSENPQRRPSPEELLLRSLAKCAATPGAEGRQARMDLWTTYAASVDAERRTRFLQALVREIEGRRMPPEALDPVPFADPDLSLVSSAALAMCVLGSPDGEDPLGAPRRVIARALRLEDDPERQGSVLQGVLLTGDRRVIALLAPARRAISETAQIALARANSGTLYDGAVDFLLTWLEERPPEKVFDAVALGLSRMRSTASLGKVLDVRRKLPVWGESIEPAVMPLREWPVLDYAREIAPRLVAIRRSRPRSLWSRHLLHVWGVDAGTPPRSVDPAARGTGRALVFRRRWATSGCYFADEEASAHGDAVRRAIGRAKTWGEFRRLLPRGEFASLSLWIENDGDHLYHDGRRYHFAGSSDVRAVLRDGDEGTVVRAGDPFDRELLPGFSDGDYPPFLEPLQDGILPREFCLRHGTRGHSFVSGSWWEFPEDKAAEMKAELKGLGFKVKIDLPAREEVL